MWTSSVGRGNPASARWLRAQGGMICFSSSDERPASSSGAKLNSAGSSMPVGVRVASLRSSSKNGWASLRAAQWRCGHSYLTLLADCARCCVNLQRRSHHARVERLDAAGRIVCEHGLQQVDALVCDRGRPLADALRGGDVHELACVCSGAVALNG